MQSLLYNLRDYRYINTYRKSDSTIMNPALSYRSNLANSSNSDSSDSEAECDVWKRSNKKPLQVDDRLPIASVSMSASPVPAISDNPYPKKRKVNNIWSDVVIEAEVSETLGQVGLTKMPGNGDRACETYDFTRKELDTRPFPEDEQNMDSEDVCNNRKSTKDTFHKKVRLNRRDAAIAKKICWKLGEPKKVLIYRIVDIIGSKKAVELLKMTEDVEEAGGMLVKNGHRRRSPGGVYLQLLKADGSITKEELDQIFEDNDDYANHLKRLKDKKKELKKLGLWKKKKSFNKRKSKHMDTSETNSTLAADFPTSEKQTISSEVSPNSTAPLDDLKQEDLKQSPAISITVHPADDLGCEDLNETSDIEDGEILD